MKDEPKHKISFAGYELDVAKRRLMRGEEDIHLNPKAFDVLVYLAENSGRIVSKDEILQAVWDSQFVEEANLAVQISTLRKALNEQKNGQRFFVNVPGKGYKFVAAVQTDEEIVIEKHSFSRLVIEKTEEEKKLQQSKFSILSFLNFSSSKIVVLLIFALAVAVGLAGYFFRNRQVTTASVPFSSQNFSIKRLTTNGKVATAAALSPDGKLFAYSQYDGEQQSLWLGHADGGEVKQIRPPADIDYSGLRFAPDGSNLYYAGSDGNGGSSLFKLPVFGGVTEKIKENIRYNISFSPDGKKIAYIRSNGALGLVIADLENGNETEIAKPPTVSMFARNSSSWSPDGKVIAIGTAVNEDGKNSEVFVCNILDGAIKPMTSHKWGSIEATTFLHDGSGLIVVAGEKGSRLKQLWYISYPDGKVSPLVSDLINYDDVINVSADNDALLTIQVQQHSNIWVVPSGNFGQAKQITFGSLGRIDGWSGLDWSADGKIFYTAVVDKLLTIWVMDADGKNQKQLTPTGQSSFHPSVSKDGRTIVFVSSHNGKNSVWLVNSDGSDLRQLTNSEIAGQPHISPDGRWVVYVSSRESYGTLYRIPSEGGEPLRLTDKKASWVRISPDSKFIAGDFEVDGKSKLGVVSIEGGELIKIFDIPRTANFRLGVRWTPDGKAVTYRDWANGIWRQNLEGGEPERLKGLPEEKLFAYGWSPDGKLFAYTRGAEIRDVVLIARPK